MRQDTIGIYNESNGKATIQNIIINVTGTNTYTGYKKCGIYNKTKGNVVIEDATIEISGNNIEYGVYNESTGEIEVRGGTITATEEGTATAYGLYNASSSIVTIKEETITAKGYQSYGIYNASTGTIIVGEEGGEVSITVPEISGSSYGMYNEKGPFNFYDGIFKGITAIYGNVTNVEPTYEVIRTKEEEIESAYLGKDVPIAKIGEQEYKTLNEAIKDCPEGEQTIIDIIRTANLTSNVETCVIEKNQDIVLDLHGYSINADNDLVLKTIKEN